MVNWLAAIPLDQSQGDRINLYQYIPTLWICALFVALFSLSTLIHLGQAIRFKLWWLLMTAVIAGIAEIMGWGARLWSSKNPTNITPYLMQISTTILAPTPLVAANFVILGRLIGRLGQQYSRLDRHWYLIIFSSADVIALIVQAVGGAKASLAVRQHGDPEIGGHIMLAGIAFQMAAITIFMLLASEFVLRFLWDRPIRIAQEPKDEGSQYLEPRIKLMFGGLALSTIAIFIRSVYRLIELTDGWTGRIITTQVYFNVLDGAMITLAMYTLNIFHPGILLRSPNIIRSEFDDSEIAMKHPKGQTIVTHSPVVA